MDLAFDFAETTGINTEAQYPYKGRGGTCAAATGGVTVTSYTDVTPMNPEAMKAQL